MKYRILTHLDQLDTLDFLPTIIIGFYEIGREKNFLSQYEVFKERFPDVDIIGSSSESNIYNSLPYVDTKGTQVPIYMCIEMNKEFYSLQLLSTSSEMELMVEKDKDYATMILSASYDKNLENIIEMLEKKIGKNSFFGAIAGVKYSQIDGSSIFYNGEYITDGTLAWLIDQEHYLFEGISVHDFHSVGFNLEITEAEGNIIYEIEGKPALTVIEEMIGTLDSESIASFDHPFFITTKKNKKSVDIPLSSLSSVNREQKSITLYRTISVGDKLKLSISFNREEQEKQLDNFSDYHRDGGIAFLFMCVAYKGHWGEMEPIYLMHLAKKIRMPFMGLHTIGQIGPLNSKDCSLIQNQTLTLAILSEK